MKSRIKVVAVAAAMVIPALSQAQSNQPVTRAQVREQLVQLENVGYNPGLDEDYPREVQHALKLVARQNKGLYSPDAAGSTQPGQ